LHTRKHENEKPQGRQTSARPGLQKTTADQPVQQRAVL
jgi:hypothetical protein